MSEAIRFDGKFRIARTKLQNQNIAWHSDAEALFLQFDKMENRQFRIAKLTLQDQNALGYSDPDVFYLANETLQKY